MKAVVSEGGSNAPSRILKGVPVDCMIDEDGNDFVNCSDEETFILSSDDGDDFVDTGPLPNLVLRRR